jgi:hypothetical protein
MIAPRDHYLAAVTTSRLCSALSAALAAIAMSACTATEPPRTAESPAPPSSDVSSSPRPVSDSPAPSPTAVAPSAPVPPRVAVRTRARLLVVRGARLSILDVDSGRTEDVPSDPRLNASRVNVWRVGRQLVFVPDESTGAGGGGGDVLATTSGPGSRLRRIGSSDPQLRPSGTRGRIWLSSVNDYDPVTEQPRTELTEVNLTGRVTRRVRFPGTFGAEPFAGGFLRHTQDDKDVELVNASGRRQRVYPGMGIAYVDAAHALLAERQCTTGCTLTLLDAGAPGVRRKVALPDVHTDIWNGLVVLPSGDELLMAVPAAAGDGPAVSLQRVGVSDGEAHAVGAWSYVFFGLRPAFTDDRRWMLFIDADRSHVNVTDLTSGKTYRAPGALPGLTQVVALGS